jgi:HPt (histidine-containing phosphotransfer) domain-containing protein
MDGYLPKPIEPRALDAELCRRLGRSTRAVAAETGRAAPAGVPSLPGFDRDKVQHLLDQAPDAWRGMVSTFLAAYPAAIGGIGIALDTGDRPGARDALHRLRGAAGALGAADLAAAAGRLEDHAVFLTNPTMNSNNTAPTVAVMIDPRMPPALMPSRPKAKPPTMAPRMPTTIFTSRPKPPHPPSIADSGTSYTSPLSRVTVQRSPFSLAVTSPTVALT